MAQPATMQPVVKGVTFKGYQDFCRERFGEQGFHTLLATRFTPEVRSLMESSLLSSKEYPTELRNRFIAELAATFGDQVEKELRALGAYCARRDLGGIYRVFFMLFSTSRTLETFAGLWRHYHVTGEAMVVAMSQNSARLEVRDKHNTPFHSIMVAGYITAILEMTGARSIEVTHHHPAGSPVATFEGHWQ